MSDRRLKEQARRLRPDPLITPTRTPVVLSDSKGFVLCSCLYGLVRVISVCSLSGIFYVLSVSWINVRNGSRRVFVVHLICDCCRARVVSSFIIAWWKTLKDLNSPRSTRKQDILFWYHLDFKRQECCSSGFFVVARFQCRLRDGPVCVWNSQNRRVLIVMYPAFLEFVKPVCILKYSSWMEKDLNHWNVGVDWFATVWVSTWSLKFSLEWEGYCLCNFKLC